MKSKHVWIIGVVILLGLSILALAAYRLDAIDRFRTERTIKKYVGRDYFKTNFRYLGTTHYRAGGPYPASVTHSYEFLPFSGKNEFIINFVDFSVSKLPPCAIEKSEDRCDFNYSYDQALELAQQRLANLGSTYNYRLIPPAVRLEKINGIYQWVASKLIEGAPDCEPVYARFYINADTGTTQDIETKAKGRGCV